MIIDAAQRYIDQIGVRDGVIAKCHQEIGLLIVGAPVHQRASITLNDDEKTAVRKAVKSWRRARKKSRSESA